jgi:Flp pilus assembly protein TadG
MMRHRTRLRGVDALRAFWRERRGASAVETAFILPGVLFLALGGSNLILLLYAVVSLHSATEAAARYASMQTADNSGTAPSASTVQTFAQGVYKGPGLGTINFAYTNTGTCGGGSNLVVGSGVYHLYYGVGRLPLNLNTQSCYP